MSCRADSRRYPSYPHSLTYPPLGRPPPYLPYPPPTLYDAPLRARSVEAQGGFSSSNGVLEVKPGEARQETPFLPALAGTLP